MELPELHRVLDVQNYVDGKVEEQKRQEHDVVLHVGHGEFRGRFQRHCFIGRHRTAQPFVDAATEIECQCGSIWREISTD